MKKGSHVSTVKKATKTMTSVYAPKMHKSYYKETKQIDGTKNSRFTSYGEQQPSQYLAKLDECLADANMLVPCKQDSAGKLVRKSHSDSLDLLEDIMLDEIDAATANATKKGGKLTRKESD